MPPIRVLVVDDSVVIRRLVTGLLSDDPDIEVVGTAINGRAALQKLESLQPDLVTMDIEMPELDGIEAVRHLRASGNRVPVIMFSTLTERGAVEEPETRTDRLLVAMIRFGRRVGAIYAVVMLIWAETSGLIALNSAGDDGWLGPYLLAAIVSGMVIVGTAALLPRR